MNRSFSTAFSPPAFSLLSFAPSPSFRVNESPSLNGIELPLLISHDSLSQDHHCRPPYVLPLSLPFDHNGFLPPFPMGSKSELSAPNSSVLGQDGDVVYYIDRKILEVDWSRFYQKQQSAAQCPPDSISNGDLLDALIYRRLGILVRAVSNSSEILQKWIAWLAFYELGFYVDFNELDTYKHDLLQMLNLVRAERELPLLDAAYLDSVEVYLNLLWRFAYGLFPGSKPKALEINTGKNIRPDLLNWVQSVTYVEEKIDRSLYPDLFRLCQSLKEGIDFSQIKDREFLAEFALSQFILH